MLLKEKTIAPSFELPDQNGKMHKLSEYKGKKVVLYFYPKDMTPGCTTEACNFRDDSSLYKEKGIVVLGVSADSIDRHKKFVEKHELPFTLLSDESKDMLKAYGVWGEKKFMGRTFNGIHRITYLIDEKGIIVKVFDKVKVKEHSDEILEFF